MTTGTGTTGGSAMAEGKAAPSLSPSSSYSFRNSNGTPYNPTRIFFKARRGKTSSGLRLNDPTIPFSSILQLCSSSTNKNKSLTLNTIIKSRNGIPGDRIDLQRLTPMQNLLSSSLNYPQQRTERRRARSLLLILDMNYDPQRESPVQFSWC